MRRFFRMFSPALALGLILFAVPAARAQFVVAQPRVVLPSVSYSYYPTTVVPSVSAYTPVTSFYATPAVSYYQPAVSYYQPAVSYYQPTVAAYPTTSYYAPVTSYYAPTTSYYAPVTAYTNPGSVTTRSFVGLGIFRPRGIYTQTYATPATTSFYSPVIWR